MQELHKARDTRLCLFTSVGVRNARTVGNDEALNVHYAQLEQYVTVENREGVTIVVNNPAVLLSFVEPCLHSGQSLIAQIMEAISQLSEMWANITQEPPTDITVRILHEHIPSHAKRQKRTAKLIPRLGRDLSFGVDVSMGSGER
ncbi:uncharacterized protein N7498_008955 [Penicillium cinerascens]|uniref:Uncharacterized protein n=1 Tax=Penicillium cinerascens TaxID=70096 RepID=A0A9W9MCS0_9EURO|nr:uncharacterized protein N7498_008955 [Penicillium cinerascens]KAJ5195517.1 hypothetical protein N7498_008955 [Penicillium cinerascens]